MFATWTFISIGRRVTQEWKFAFRLRGDSILPFKGQIKNIRNLWISTIRIISGRHSLFQFFPLLDASGARALVATQVPQSATRQRCDAMSSCRPKCTFFVHLRPFGFFCGASTEVAIFSSVSMFHPFVEYQPQWFYRILLNIQKKTNPIPPFAQASFLKFATLPRDRKWHISKLATLPRAPYQPHARKYHGMYDQITQ